jgi:methionyl-tRNA formyltransferase
MTFNKNLLALGRSGYLYHGIRHVVSRGYAVKVIVTEEAYEEYDIKHDDFKRLADEIGAAFFMVKSLNAPEILSLIEQHNIRAAISANWKYTVQKQVLDLFDIGILNFHLGNLPDYKGNATVNWTIIQGEPYINGNIHKMDPQLDAGDIISRKAIPITRESYIADILAQAELDAPGLYLEALDNLLADSAYVVEKGSVEGLRCYPRLPEDSQIDWHSSAEDVHRLIRASAHPYKGAFTYFRGEKAVIWKARLVPPGERYLAIPGHIVKINNQDQTITVAAGDGLLIIEEMAIGEEVNRPTQWCRSIRERFKNS